MIKINDVEIMTVGEGMTWKGDKDTVSRTLNFTILYVPEDTNFPKYQVKCGDKVEWKENDKILFYGYVQSIDYSTDGESINVSCIDLMVRLLKSKCIGRFKGTLNDLCNSISKQFRLENEVNSDNTHIHNIVSTGDLSYFDILKTACDTMFSRYTLYLDGLRLKLNDHVPVATFKIGENIRSSSFKQDFSDLVTRVLIIDDNGKQINSVENADDLKKYGLFQEVYTYSKDCKNNLAEAKKLLKTVSNEATIEVNNDNSVVAGCFIKVYEPINNFTGTFEVLSDSHTIGTDSVMTLEIKYVTE